jgi:hemin uptake protein HemP
VKQSQTISLKILGVVFCSSCWATDYTQAITVAGRAGLIQSGAKERITRLKNQYVKDAKALLNQYDLTSEAATLGAAVQVAKEKKILIQHHGTEYLIGPREIKIRIQF